MVYESDFYTTRRPYRTTPSYSTYTTSIPRHYVVHDTPDRARRAAEEQYSYSYSSNVESRNGDPYSRPQTRSYATTERVSRNSDYGPGNYSYSTERSSRSTGDGPSGYHSSYSSTTSGRLPGGTSYRHYSYRLSRQVRILPGLGKVHVVHSYDRLIPYVGHKRLTVITTPSPVVKVRPSVLWREYDRIEHKYRPLTYYSPTSAYLNSNSSVTTYYSPYTGTRYYTIYRPVRLGYINTYTSPYTGITYRTSSYPTTLSSYRSSSYDYPYSFYYNYPYSGYSSTPYYNGYYSSYYPYYYSRNYPYYYSSYYPYYSSYYPYTSNYDYSFYSYPSKLYMYRAFDDETRYIKAQAASLLRRVHAPTPRPIRALPLPYLSTSSYDLTPSKYSNDYYIQRLITSNAYNPRLSFTTYYTEPVRKFVGGGHLACIVYAADKAYPRRTFRTYDDPVKNDIQLLSYYIAKFRDQKALKEPSKAQLNPARSTRVFNPPRFLKDSMAEEMKELQVQRAERLARIYAVDDEPRKPKEEDLVSRDIKRKEEERLAQLKAAEEEKVKKEAERKREIARKEDEARKAAELAKQEEDARKAEAARKEEEARKVELAKQEELAAKAAAEKAAAEKAAELERQAELARQEELAKQAELERLRAEEEEHARLEEEKREAELIKQEEERQQLLRLEEIAREAEEEKEADLARQAEELAELARQEAELAEQQRIEDEISEEARKVAEAEEIARREEELVELAKQEQELAEQAERAREEAELAELLRQQAELDALEAEARALLEDVPQSIPADEYNPPAGGEVVEEEQVEEVASAEVDVTTEEPAAVEEEEVQAEESPAEEAVEEQTTIPVEQEEEEQVEE